MQQTHTRVQLAVGIVYVPFFLSLIISFVLFALDDNSPRSFFGAATSGCFLCIPVVIAMRGYATPVHGMLTMASTQIIFPSFFTWLYKEFYSWPADRKANGTTDAFELDTFCMVTLGACACGLVVQQIFGTGRRPLLFTVAAILTAHFVGSTMNDFDGSIVNHFNELTGVFIGSTFILALIKDRKVLLHGVHLLVLVIGIIAAHSVAFRYIEFPVLPRVRDFVAGFWHMSIAVGILYLLLEDAPPRYIPTASRIAVLFTPCIPIGAIVLYVMRTDLSYSEFYTYVYSAAIIHAVLVLYMSRTILWQSMKQVDHIPTTNVPER